MSDPARRRAGESPADAVRRRPWGVWTLLAIVLIGPLAGLGCDEDRRYRILSFFFDGVPDPHASTQPDGSTTQPDGMGRLAGRGGGPGEASYFEHAPYRTRQCNGCHSPAGMAVAVAAQGSMCGKCHTSYVQAEPSDWVHGPVAVGECGLCHLPHRSPIAGLLTKPIPDLCLDCHSVLGMPERPYHRPGESGQLRACTDCHDPHMAGNRLLLNDSRSLARRKSGRAMLSSHKPFEQRKCTECHVAGRQNQVIDNIDSACLKCHAKSPKEVVPPPGKLHEAVRTGHCINCHDPHGSPRPHLVRTNGEKMCFSCHKLSDIARPDHPGTASADCWVCHAGHKSDRPHLLREGVPASAPDMGAPPWVPPGGR